MKEASLLPIDGRSLGCEQYAAWPDDNDYVMAWDEVGPWEGKLRMVH